MAPIQTTDPSLFHIESISQYVSLPPSSLATPLPSLCAALFSPLLLTYFSPARGIVLSYSNLRLADEPPARKKTRASSHSYSPSHSPSHSRRRRDRQSPSPDDDSNASDTENPEEHPLLCKITDEYNAAFLWATADFLVFRPRTNAWIEGRITHQSSSHITLAFLNSFPVAVMREGIPLGWAWVATTSQSAAANEKQSRRRGRGVGEGHRGDGSGAGYWIGDDGMPISDILSIRIRDFEAKTKSAGGKGHFRIEGSLLSVEEEKEVEIERQRQRQEKGKKQTRGILRSPEGRGIAVEDGEGMDVDPEGSQ
ncbi:uncharacterized protein BDR25DRAFT_307839 [Lindgomyces ingoldianus]|uniref:Uncharacterized protein n=1 Tax=Lindgomyces ingoldianus TaxID=673940 RepID=A0ACB6Q940_9PLEO|nr:uncharacterized protein BDR25DRAFT_307839 [Lindgomyces ingoldianus]KAF2463406.1 hypothetical protein BDR25DRAFT_307839 [Lindgomyces ingoldianus]